MTITPTTLFRAAAVAARVLARWAAALLAVGGLVTVALSVLPDAFYRFLAFPNGIAMAALGYSLWRTVRIDTTLPTPVDGSRLATTAGAE
jgi:preprotein translocase subunit SecY